MGCNKKQAIKNLGKYAKKGNKFSKEEIKRIREGENNPFYGRKHKEDSKKSMSETKKRLFKDGILMPNSGCYKKGHKPIAGFKKGNITWNTGLTKETDIRVKNQANKSRGKKRSDITRKKLSLAKEIKLDMDLIKREYLENEKSCKELGRMFGTNHGTIWNRLKKEGVKIRENRVCIKRTRIKQSVAKQGIPLNEWNGFVSRGPYDKNFNNKFKRAIRKRDNQICLMCGIHREKLPRTLDVHHINYNKLMSIEQNCISLCRKCHIQTNYNREIWTKHFQELLSKLYSYQYSENQEIIIGGIM